MERFIKGEIVVLPFPFSDLSSNKKRPALVLSDLNNEDIILCQITSRYFFDEWCIEINYNSFKYGNLNIESYIRCNKLFTASKSIIINRIGVLNRNVINEVEKKLIDLLIT